MVTEQSPTAYAVYKYRVPVADEFNVELPRHAEILTVQVQDGHPHLWALVNPNNLPEMRHFVMRGTGHPIGQSTRERLTYVGTFQLRLGTLVFHLFEFTPRREETES